MAVSQQIVVVGAGEVGQHLARILSKGSHRVTVVDTDPEKIRLMNESLDVQALVGDGTRPEVLTHAGVVKASLLIAVTNNDHVNMLACLLGRQLGAKRRILRVQDTGILDGYHNFYRDTIGYDVVLSTSELAAREVIETVKERHALEVETYCEGKIQLRRLRQPEGELLGVPLKEMRLTGKVVLVGIQRSTDSSRPFIVPGGDDSIQAGDQILVMGEASDLDAFEREVGKHSALKREVIIMGAGRIGRAVASKLSNTHGVSVKVIEHDSARARALEQMGDDFLVLTGNATDLELLREEHIGKTDVFVATTKDDEDNLVACQIARVMGVGRTVAIVNKASYGGIYDLMGVDLAISPRELCAKRIMRLVRASSPRAVSILAEGKAEVLELEVRLKEPTTIAELNLPPTAKIGARMRGDTVSVPGGGETLKTGDRVIVLSLSDALDEVEAILTGEQTK
jgi:trk system potassium uptake protein TrkA